MGPDDLAEDDLDEDVLDEDDLDEDDLDEEGRDSRDRRDSGEGHDGQGRPRQAEDGHGSRGHMSAAQAARAGLRGLMKLIGKRPEGIVAIEPSESGWSVAVEVVEDRRVPSTADILAVYEAQLDKEGTLMSYRRVKRYPRGRGDNGGDR